ncbi:uncharacterized protein GJ701_008657 isoform 1-T1 [Geothlypis trichas]
MNLSTQEEEEYPGYQYWGSQDLGCHLLLPSQGLQLWRHRGRGTKTSGHASREPGTMMEGRVQDKNVIAVFSEPYLPAPGRCALLSVAKELLPYIFRRNICNETSCREDRLNKTPLPLTCCRILNSLCLLLHLKPLVFSGKKGKGEDLQCGSVTLELVHLPEEPGESFFPSDNWRTENRDLTPAGFTSCLH